MRKIYWIIALVFLSSCITESKVNRWLDNHKGKAAGYCADKFPSDTTTRTITQNIDSAGYYEAYLNMSYLSDSLLNELQRRAQAATPEKPYRPNIDSIRKVVDAEIRKRLKPCIDTVKVVTNTVIDRAKEAALKYLVDEKDKVITGQQKDIQELNDKVRAKTKWIWMFWGLAALVIGYALLKLKVKLPI
jgi:hypothetical protein